MSDSDSGPHDRSARVGKIGEVKIMFYGVIIFLKQKEIMTVGK
ncbi:hypothetical protein SLEP1_g4885 [Rubroshorea leprosula]|uniref:Translation initiation factor 1 n=1 Tax=Rubroshorea leprosula TaxID=152421 RepID=A0AAV5HZ22_9ROSI|nr:hypothetical protein SLEP1_g4885 [Rubroshorea leprosula]